MRWAVRSHKPLLIWWFVSGSTSLSVVGDVASCRFLIAVTWLVVFFGPRVYFFRARPSLRTARTSALALRRFWGKQVLIGSLSSFLVSFPSSGSCGALRPLVLPKAVTLRRALCRTPSGPNFDFSAVPRYTRNCGCSHARAHIAIF